MTLPGDVWHVGNQLRTHGRPQSHLGNIREKNLKKKIAQWLKILKGIENKLKEKCNPIEFYSGYLFYVF